MKEYYPKRKSKNIPEISILSLVMVIMLSSCINFHKTEKGITYVADRGSKAVAQIIDWSPTDENNVLVTAFQTPNEPAEVYILDITTGQKNDLLPQQHAYFIDSKWIPDSRHVAILSGGAKGLNPPGWWMMDIEDRSTQYIMPPGDAAWSPDGKTIAVLRRATSRTGFDLLFVNMATKAEEKITTLDGADMGFGISWSPDGQQVVFSVGRQGLKDLYVLNTETKQIIILNDNDKEDELPAWSPKGNIIAYQNNFSLYLISADGKCKIKIPDTPDAFSPTWSPDGKRLGYLSTDGIYVLDVEKVLGRDIYQNLCP
jgi:Tol biopolymer transport system component